MSAPGVIFSATDSRAREEFRWQECARKHKPRTGRRLQGALIRGLDVAAKEARGAKDGPWRKGHGLLLVRRARGEGSRFEG